MREAQTDGVLFLERAVEKFLGGQGSERWERRVIVLKFNAEILRCAQDDYALLLSALPP